MGDGGGAVGDTRAVADPSPRTAHHPPPFFLSRPLSPSPFHGFDFTRKDSASSSVLAPARGRWRRVLDRLEGAARTCAACLCVADRVRPPPPIRVTPPPPRAGCAVRRCATALVGEGSGNVEQKDQLPSKAPRRRCSSPRRVQRTSERAPSAPACREGKLRWCLRRRLARGWRALASHRGPVLPPPCSIFIIRCATVWTSPSFKTEGEEKGGVMYFVPISPSFLLPSFFSFFLLPRLPSIADRRLSAVASSHPPSLGVALWADSGLVLVAPGGGLRREWHGFDGRGGTDWNAAGAG